MAQTRVHTCTMGAGVSHGTEWNRSYLQGAHRLEGRCSEHLRNRGQRGLVAGGSAGDILLGCGQQEVAIVEGHRVPEVIFSCASQALFPSHRDEHVSSAAPTPEV